MLVNPLPPVIAHRKWRPDINWPLAVSTAALFVSLGARWYTRNVALAHAAAALTKSGRD